MTILEGLVMGAQNMLQPLNLFILVAATLIGFLGGALPGISGTMMVILFLPLSYAMDPIPAFILLTTVYSISVFSGLISAILFRTPGTPEAVATVFDGYPMAQKGKAGQALGIGIFCSAIGGIIGCLFLIFLTPPLSNLALSFSSPEYFSLALMGLTVVVSLGGKDLTKGFIGVCLGLFLATIGMDPLTGTERFTFNNVALLSGVDLIPVIIGLFSVSEVLRKSKEKTTLAPELREIKTNIKIKIFDMEIFKRIWRTMAKSSIIGVIIGILPGIGATTAAMVSYSEAVRSSKNPEEFGTGIPEGIAAPETANNAAAMGTLIPLISLGIPGGATAAVLLGAFVLHGLQPGPMLIVNAPDLVYTLFIALLLGNILILLLSKPFIRVFSKILNIPYMALGPMILVFCIIGTYAVNNSVFDIWIMLLFGLLGYLFDKIKFPISTIILGLVLGPLTETEFRRSLEMSNGDFSIFFTRPISCGLLILAAIAFIYGLYKTYKKQSSVRVIAD
ncbi:MAG: tripartite tricarboxylate transporter permease [Atribacterales bacterium]